MKISLDLFAGGRNFIFYDLQNLLAVSQLLFYFNCATFLNDYLNYRGKFSRLYQFLVISVMDS